MKEILITTSSFRAEGFSQDMRIHTNPYGRKLTEDELIALFHEIRPVGMIAGVEPITARALEAAPDLRVISRCGVGIDSVDAKAVRERGIALRVTAEAPALSVSELTLALMLDLLKRVGPLDRGMRAGGWKGAPGRLLMGKRVGVIGCGRIGARVARLVRAFDARPVGYDPYMASHPEMEMVPLDSLLREADIVTLHVPLTAETHHMIDGEALAEMKRGALLLNVARGGLVDEAALALALREGRLGGAALDCYEREPYAGELSAMENVLLSPHMGSSAIEGRAMMERDAVKNLVDALS